MRDSYRDVPGAAGASPGGVPVEVDLAYTHVQQAAKLVVRHSRGRQWERQDFLARTDVVVCNSVVFTGLM